MPRGCYEENVFVEFKLNCAATITVANVRGNFSGISTTLPSFSLGPRRFGNIRKLRDILNAQTLRNQIALP